MRAYFIAVLVSLSCAAGTSRCLLAQQPPWYTPVSLEPTANRTDASTRGKQTTVAESTSSRLRPAGTSQPRVAERSDASENASSFSQRFGDLLSKPGARLAIATGNEQRDIVTAGGHGEPQSTHSPAVPWATGDTRPSTFFEPQSPTTSQPASASSRRGALVSPLIPQVSPQLRTAAPSTPANATVPWVELTPAPNVRSSNWPLLDRSQPTTPLQRPGSPTTASQTAASQTTTASTSQPPSTTHGAQPLAAQLISAAKPVGKANDELSLILPIPADKLEMRGDAPLARASGSGATQPSETRPSGIASPAERAQRSSRVAQLPQQAASQTQAPAETWSPSDLVPDPPEPPPSLAPTTTRLTDKPDSPRHGPETAQGNETPGRPSRLSTPGPTPLLNTESMIGPLRGAEQLFSRLQLDEDLRGFASPAVPGAREDVNQYSWMPTPYTWISPAFYHYPLYFEQPNLERYGIGKSRVVQPMLSSIHFFGSIPLIPYKTLTHNPREHIYTLGQGRPGNCVPVQRGVVLGTSTVGDVSMFWEHRRK